MILQTQSEVEDFIRSIETRVLQSVRKAEEPITIQKAAEILEVDPKTVGRWGNKGLLRVHTIGGKKYLYLSQIKEDMNRQKFK